LDEASEETNERAQLLHDERKKKEKKKKQ